MTTNAELQQIQESKKIFNELKSDGSRLLKEGKIDPKTYYAKTRQAGIELGLIGENEYPGRLPNWVEPTLEVIGGIGGTVGGFMLGGPPGAVIGAGSGSGSMSLATDFLGDLLAPDMPSPSAKERLTDAALTGTIDTVLTAATPIVSRAVSPILKRAIQGGKNVKDKAATKIQDFIPSQEKGTGIANKLLGISDEAAEKAAILGKEGIELSLGQASSSPFVQGAYNLTSRMPLVGTSGQSQLAKTFKQVESALNRRISPTARLKPLTESERSELIKKVGLQSFKDWRNSYKTVYKKADSLNKQKGKFFDMGNLSKTAERLQPKSQFTKAPSDIKSLLDNLEGKELKGKAINIKLGFDDVEALDTKLTDLSKKYDPAKSQTPNNYAYNTSIKLLDVMKRQLRNPNDQAGRLYGAGDKLFKTYMEVVENKTGKEFQQAFGRGSIRPGIGRPPTQRMEDLYSKTFGDNKSPQAVKELRNLIGKQELNKIAGNYLDDIFTKYIKTERKDFDGLFKELGFENTKSLKYEATQELLKDYQFTKAEDLNKLLNALKMFPEVLPDVNTLIMRAGALRAASNLGPSAVIGATGATAGVPAIGLLYGFNKFLSLPFNKDLVNKAVKSNPRGIKALLRKFLDSLPVIPDMPVSSVAVQPLVPFVEQEITQ